MIRSDAATRERWQDDALCAETTPDAFFPQNGSPATVALAICAACGVRAQCLEYALTNGLHDGIYGGLSPSARRKLRRRTV